MFKVGDRVQIKPRSEIEILNRKLYIPLPLDSLLKYCGQVGRITWVSDRQYNGHYTCKIDTTKDYQWFTHEIALYEPDENFISIEDLCL